MNDLPTPHIQPVGEVTIEVRDADTLDLKRTIKNKNVMTSFGFNRAFAQTSYNAFQWWGISSFGADWSGIYISTRQMSAVEPQSFVRSYVTLGNTKLVLPTWVDGVPPYVEVKWRFNAPGIGNARTIYTIYFGNEDLSSPTTMFAYTSLDVPCTQADNEVLDVTYRIQMITQTVGPSVVGISPDYGYLTAKGFFVDDKRGGYDGPTFTDGYWNAKMPVGGSMRTPNLSYDNLGKLVSTFTYTTASAGGQAFKRTFPVSLTDIEKGGKIFGMLAYGGNVDATATGSSRTFSTTGHRNTVWAPMTSATFPNKPIQPIHNHNVNAVSPFMDVNFLATSQGTLTTNGTSWTNPDFPSYYRVEYTKSGNVGTSRYFFRKRKTLGFENYNAFRQRLGQSAQWRAFSSAPTVANTPGSDGMCSIASVDRTQCTGNEYHGIKPSVRLEEYDISTMISWDDNGIIVQDQADPNRLLVLDATTTPALPVTRINQCSRDAAGNIFVACRNTGLFKINNPFGSPTVTSITNSIHGVPDPGGGGAPKCYGVHEGYNDRTWALFEGGLSYSDNSGVTWTNLNPSSTPIFSTASITPSNWSRVQYIAVDRSNSTHQLGIVFDPTGDGTGNDWKICWYTPAGGGVATEYARSFTSFYRSVNCSYRGGMWVAYVFASAGNKSSYRLKFGDAAITNELSLTVVTNGSNYDTSKPVFFYDYYNNPLSIGVGGGPFGSFYYTGLFQSDGELICNLHGTESTNGAWCSIWSAWERNPIGLHWTNNYYNRGFSGNDIPTEEAIGPTALTGTLTEGADLTLNHRYSPLEETVWTKYHWNGAAWQANYFAPATDTSGNGFSAPRHNFNTESNYFTGRAMIDTTPAFPASTFSTIATMAFKIVPSPKYNSSATRLIMKNQETTRTLIDLADPSVSKRVQVVWSSLTNNLTIVDDTTGTTTTTVVGVTPANNSTHRVIVVINGTTLKVYVNGVAFGSNVTLGSTMNFANATGKLKAYLGARAYIWKYQTSNTLVGEFFRGTMENVQFWNVAWDATDVTNDFGNIDGVIVSKPIGNMIARYQLTQVLEGTETKITHTPPATLDDGITLGFNNGVSGTAFVATDYHTFGVCDGIMKDNAITLSQEYGLYLKPTLNDFIEFKNPANTNTVPGTPTQVTETACWSFAQLTDSQPGSAAVNAVSVDSWTTNKGVATVQKITGDGWFEAKPSETEHGCVIGFSTSPTANKTLANVTYGIICNFNGTVDIIGNGVVSQVAVSTYTRRDLFRVERTGTTVRFYKVIAGVPTQIGVASGVVSTGSLYGIITFYGDGRSVFDAKINWTQPAYVMRIGNPSTLTGAYNSYFFVVDVTVPTSLLITIDGTPATVLVQALENNNWWDNMPVPGPGQVTVNQKSGHLTFNSADVGKVIAGAVSVTFSKI